jgi:hypothetical protein
LPKSAKRSGEQTDWANRWRDWAGQRIVSNNKSGGEHWGQSGKGIIESFVFIGDRQFRGYTDTSVMIDRYGHTDRTDIFRLL